MRTASRILTAAVAGAALLAPASAQDRRDTAFDVSFFERVAVGDVEITPFGIVEDTRCLDYRLCFRSDRLVISAVVHQFDGSWREIRLSLDELTPVRGGALLLTAGGTPPVRNGGIPLERYKLDIVFVPYEREYRVR